MKVTLIVGWIIIASLSLAYVWGGNPDAFPRPPQSFAIWITDLFGAQDAEAIGRLEVHYMLVVSFIVVSVCTFLALFFWKHFGKSKPHVR
jgi:heme/copper-type cytochrome/quinol oxidase subunit 2